MADSAHRATATAGGTAGPPRRWRPAAFAALAAACAVLMAACADMPSTGPVQSTPAPQGGSGSNCCALVMSGPKPGWSPTEIVSGFLLASASFAHGNAIAREYLTPAASQSWSPGSAVTIVDQAPTVIAQPRRIGPESAVTVVASGQVVATLSSSGQYKPVTGNGQTARQEIFTVQRYGGEWRIASLPGTGRVSRELLLPQGLFNLVYKPQNLYFFAHGSGGRVLVPDPVFVPSDSSDPATRLVSALMSGVPGWLDGAAVSGFPAHTRLRSVQVLPGPQVSKTAIVNLAIPPQAVTPEALQKLDAQLVWTLTSHSYGEPLVQAVKLKVNGHFWPASGSPVLTQADYRDRVPGPPAHADLYYVGADGRVMVLGQPGRSSAAPSTPVPGAAGQGHVHLSTIAVSPDHDYLAGTSQAGTTVYVSNLAAAADPHAKPQAAAIQAQLSGSSFSSLSWDRADNLWVTGRVGGIRGVWVLPHGQGPPVEVGLPPQLGTVTALKVAPDGARVAMITGHGPAASLVIGAIVRGGGQYVLLNVLPVGPNLPAPTAVAWYDPDHLLAVSGSGAGTQLWEVPVNGNSATRQGALPGIVSVAAAGPQNALYLGLDSGQLERSAGFAEFWSGLAAGRAATYPG